MLLAVGLWTACRDTNDVIEDVNVENPNGEAFISLNVVLPSSVSPGTRAGEGTINDKFEDGIAAEYDVKNMTVILFDAADLTAAKVKKVYKTTDGQFLVPDFQDEGSATDNITTVGRLGVIEVPEETTYYALVIANDNGQLPAITEGATTFADINEALTNKDKTKFNSTGFFMSNSPIKEGTAADPTVTTLVACKSFITAAEATEKASTIYLERILGKVQVLAATETGWLGWTYTVPSGTHAGDNVVFSDWGLDMTNTKTFPVRKVDETNWLDDSKWKVGGTGSTNRFYGIADKPVRIYYAIDPNYDWSPVDPDDFNKITPLNLTALTTSGAGANYDYCLENTFNTANQRQNQTTRVVMKGTYTLKGKTGNFYRTQSNIYYDETELSARVLAEVKKLAPFVTSVTFTLNTTDVSAVTISSITPDIESLTPENLATVNAAIGKLGYYEGGVCYYVARIKHFGESLTPWNAGDPTYGDTTDAERDYLGRYGVVRNNWYVLTINKVINGPGEPKIPDTPDTPDDEAKYYLDCTIKILSWAKRYQGVDW